jgi:CheY-like chemotaxis protein
MPEQDGIECTKTIRNYEKSNNSLHSIYIVAVTANNDASDRLNCIEAGMNDFISKPFKENEIKDKILNALIKQKTV